MTRVNHPCFIKRSLMSWTKIKEILSHNLQESAYSIWILPLSGAIKKNRVLEISGPDKFFTTWVADNYLDEIKNALAEIGHGHLDIAFNNINSPASQPMLTARQQAPRLPNIPRAKSWVRTLHPRYTFKEFMVGEPNYVAHSACEALAANDTAMGNCVYLKGGTGLGKSHLSHAVAHHIVNNSPGTRLHFLSAQQLTSDMIDHIKNKTMANFKDKYHNQCDVLLLEDIQALSRRIKTQEELAEALDILMETGKRIIFTGSLPPCEIPDIDPGFRSRLSSGLIATINPPDQGTRVKIIKRKASNNDLSLSPDLIEYLAANLKGDVRQVESTIINLKAQAALLKTDPDFAMIRETLANIINQAQEYSPELIRDFIAAQFKVDTNLLCSKSRKKTVAFPRQVIMYLSRKYTDQSLADIGRILNRDHSTVVHSVRVITEKMARNASVRGQVNFLAEKLEKHLI